MWIKLSTSSGLPLIDLRLKPFVHQLRSLLRPSVKSQSSYTLIPVQPVSKFHSTQSVRRLCRQEKSWLLWISLKITHVFFKMLHRDSIATIPRQHYTLLQPIMSIQESYVIRAMSDCLHQAQQLFTFFKSFLTKELQPKKIIYFCDSAASQYKNLKNFINLCHHRDDFGISAEWHFSATLHGKGACDGLEGTVKRLAARTSLQRPYNDQIMTPCQLFEWASTNIPAAHFGYCSKDDYEREAHYLEQRFHQSCTIPGTRKLHSFVPISNRKVRVSFYSNSGKKELIKKRTISTGINCWVCYMFV